MVVAFSASGYPMLVATLAVEVVAGFSLILLLFYWILTANHDNRIKALTPLVRRGLASYGS